MSGDVFTLFDGILAVLIARVLRLTQPLLLVSPAAFCVPSSRLSCFLLLKLLGFFELSFAPPFKVLARVGVQF